MKLLGTVEPFDGATAERNAWVALISAHSSLAPVAPRQGINPFTRKPHSFEARADSARIVLDGIDVGTVFSTSSLQRPGLDNFVWPTSLVLLVISSIATGVPFVPRAVRDILPVSTRR